MFVPPAQGRVRAFTLFPLATPKPDNIYIYIYLTLTLTLTLYIFIYITLYTYMADIPPDIECPFMA